MFLDVAAGFSGLVISARCNFILSIMRIIFSSFQTNERFCCTKFSNLLVSFIEFLEQLCPTAARGRMRPSRSFFAAQSRFSL